MNNEITLETVKNYKNIIEKIFDYSKDALLNFMHLGQLLKRVKEYKLYEIEEFQSVYDFALNKFGYKETSVKNFIAVFEKYADSEDLDYDYFDIKEEYKNYSFTSLVELLPVPEEEIKENYTPEMSVKEIRQTKVISQLTDQLQEKVKKYNHVVDILKKEMNNFNEELDKDVVKYRVVNNTTTIDDFRLRSGFEHGWRSFYVDYDIDLNLRVNYQNIDNLSDDEIIKKFKDDFLMKVKEIYLNDVKEKEEKKLQKIKEKESLYSEISLPDLQYKKEFFYVLCMYLYYIILNSDKSEYNIKVLVYKKEPIYELEIEYQNLMIGYFGYNDETKETYFKFKLPKSEESNNQLFKDYDLFYWTIDNVEKRCDLFSSHTLKRIEKYYHLLK